MLALNPIKIIIEKKPIIEERFSHGETLYRVWEDSNISEGETFVPTESQRETLGLFQHGGLSRRDTLYP